MSAELIDCKMRGVIDRRYSAIVSQLLPPWATFYRRYAACLRSLYFRVVCFGQPNESPRI